MSHYVVSMCVRVLARGVVPRHDLFGNVFSFTKFFFSGVALHRQSNSCPLARIGCTFGTHRLQREGLQREAAARAERRPLKGRAKSVHDAKACEVLMREGLVQAVLSGTTDFARVAPRCPVHVASQNCCGALSAMEKERWNAFDLSLDLRTPSDQHATDVDNHKGECLCVIDMVNRNLFVVGHISTAEVSFYIRTQVLFVGSLSVAAPRLITASWCQFD